MRINILLIFILFVANFRAQDTLRALFIGNSYTAVNNLPEMLSQLSTSLGDVLIYDSNTPGGQTFQNHAANMVNYQKMAAQSWDYIVLQGQSQEPSFPTAQVNSQTLPYALLLADSAKSIQPCAQVNFFMTWGRQNGDPQWDSINTFDKMNLRLRNAYLRIADSANAAVSPVGIAWKYLRDHHPNINLYQQDGSHPSTEGSYLAACVFYSSFFHKVSMGSTYNPGIDPNTAELIQNVASSIVLDSLFTWQLIHPDSTLQLTTTVEGSLGSNLMNFSANANQEALFTWFFPDGTILFGANVSYDLNLSSYQVILAANGPCSNDTTTITITNPNAGIAEHFNLNWKLTGPQQIAVEATDIFMVRGFDLTAKEHPITFEKKGNQTLISFTKNTSIIQIISAKGLTNIRVPYLID
jgi:hypothetical protein